MSLSEHDSAAPYRTPFGHRLNGRAWAVRALLFAGLVAAIVVAFPRDRATLAVYQEGETWRGETLRAPYDIALQRDPDELSAARRRVRSEIVPVLRELPGQAQRIPARRDTLAGSLAATLAQYDRMAASVMAGRRAQASADSVRLEQLRRQLPVVFAADAWQALVAWHVSVSDSTALARLVQEAADIATALAGQGVVDVSRDSLRAPVVYIRSDATRTDRIADAETLVTLDDADRIVERALAERYGGGDPRVGIGAALVRTLLAPSYIYQNAAVQAEYRRRLDGIALTQGEVRRGEVIVERGQRITPEIRRRLASLDLARSTHEGTQGSLRTSLGQALLGSVTLLLLFLFLALLRPVLFASDRQMIAISLLVGVSVLFYGLAVRLAAIEMLAVPVAIVAVLMTVMFDSRVGVFVSVTLAVIGGLLLRFDLGYTATVVVGCIFVVFSVRDVRKRGQFIGSAALLFGVFALVLGGQWLVGHLSPARFVEELTSAGLHAGLLLLTYPLLWGAERLFGVTTDVTLLELSGTDHPLLRELQANAPGTFSHTMQVAALADTAAAAIGANRLLARVGALYHDVGKLARPQYFVENQGRGDNPHASLSPHLSARIIADHVREGLDLARQHRLPAVVRAFIPMHHGTMRIEYFYRKALDAQKEGDPAVEETDFRYGGPRPDTREAAILMLADGVEAAARSLDDPSPHRIEALVNQIVEARRADGQLDRSPLTFDDLRVIRETLTRSLVSHYHGRIKYPGAPAEEPRPKRRRGRPDGS